MSGYDTSAQAYVPITATPTAPPRLGLLTSVATRTDVPATWINGFVIENPEDCAPTERDPGWWCPEAEGEGSTPAGPTADPRIADVYYRPWFARVTDGCSALTNPDEYAPRARRKYVAAESRIIEAELWAGTVAQAAGFPNRYLADTANVDDFGTMPFAYALAALQEYLAETIDGRGMIHASPRTASLWTAAQLVRREGNLLLDPFDNIVVAGQGYDGSGPGNVAPPLSGDRHYAYATSMVTVLREGQVTVDPTSMVEATDRTINRTEFTAGRIVAAYWDGCAHAGVEVNLCEPDCTPSGS